MKENVKNTKLNYLKGLKRSKCHGFTLVEILVAVIILSVGILAVSQMTVMGIKVNTVVNQRMYARVVMAQVFENLNNLPSNHAWLTDAGDPNLNAGVFPTVDSFAADHFNRVSDQNALYSYLTIWNVTDDLPEPSMKTIRIWVIWGPGFTNKISSDLIKSM
ncbi:MAG: prepilin-type N-terminal cleavage/methylation domain-containing protein [bacterium]